MRHVLTLSALAALVVVVAAAVATAAPAAVVAFVGPDPVGALGPTAPHGTAPAPGAAVVDRLGDDRAVLLLEGDGARDPEQRVVDPEVIPERGRHEGAVLDATDEGYAYNRTATETRERDFSRWFDALSGRFREPPTIHPELDPHSQPDPHSRPGPRPSTAALGIAVV